MKHIILASSSPQRKDLLETLGIPFRVDPSNFNEETVAIADPEKRVAALALAKAKSVAARHRGTVVVGADTMVSIGGDVFGKPRNADHAREMLQRLNGQEHFVVTGVALYDTDTHHFLTDAVSTRLRFKTVNEAEIEAYVKSGEPFGKAGGYAIQGLGSFLVDAIDGDYQNVVGLPVERLKEMFAEFR